jgi:hypothetical protein
VELQDFAPQHLYSQLVFAEPEASILDRRGATTKAMREHLKLSNYTLHPTAVEVASDDNRNQYRIGIAQVFASLMSFDDFAGASSQTRGFLEMALEHLQNPGVAELNVRTYDIAPTDSFEQLRDSLIAGLAPGAKGLISTVGVPLTDAGWVFEFNDQNSAVSVQLGPMLGGQLEVMLRDQGSGSYPPNALFLSVDSKLRREDAKSPDAVDWWSRAVEGNRKRVARIGEWLREMMK